LLDCFVDELNAFVAVGELQNVVVLVQLGKVKIFEDNYLKII